MQINVFRSPFQKESGLHHFARVLDKIRLHQAGRLPEEYHPNFGSRTGLDGHLCGFLGVEHAEVYERVREGGSDEDVVRWCFQRGLRPNKIQIRIWNEFRRKFEWNDDSSKFLPRMKQEDGLEHRTDIVITLELIDLREGRAGQPPSET